MNDCNAPSDGCDSSSRNASTLRITSAITTSAGPPPASRSSPIGNIVYPPGSAASNLRADGDVHLNHCFTFKGSLVGISSARQRPRDYQRADPFIEEFQEGSSGFSQRRDSDRRLRVRPGTSATIQAPIRPAWEQP